MIFIYILNFSIIMFMYKIYKKLPRTSGLTVDYFKSKLEDFEDVPTY